MRKIIKNAQIPFNGIMTKDNDVLIEDGIIKYVGQLKEKEFKNNEIIDASNYYLIPGFIDCHGANGYDAYELKQMAIDYAGRGVTGFYVTIGPESNQEYFRMFEECRKAFGSDYLGACFLGIHLEGPFLSLEKKGAMDEKKLRQVVTPEEVEELIDAGADVIKIITISPELEGAYEAINKFAEAGIVVSLGHSMATYKQAMRGIEEGATQVTHMYNAMRAYEHREPGIMGAAILSDDIYCELIMDCVHVSEEAMKILIKSKGTDKIMAVSDGDIKFGHDSSDRETEDYIIKDGAIYLKNGVLYGSTRDVADHFKTIIVKLGLGIPDAVKMTSTNCGTHMKIKKGKIEKGFDADFNFVDSSFKVRKTFISGQEIIL